MCVCVYIYIYIYIKREREREISIILCEKYGLNRRNDIKFIQNKIGRIRVKILERERDEGSVMVE